MTINATGPQGRETGARLVKSADCTLAAAQTHSMVREAAIETDTFGSASLVPPPAIDPGGITMAIGRRWCMSWRGRFRWRKAQTA